MSNTQDITVNGGSADGLRLKILKGIITTILFIASLIAWFYSFQASDGIFRQLMPPLLIINGIVIGIHAIRAFFIGGYDDERLFYYILMTFVVAGAGSFVYLCLTHPEILSDPKSSRLAGLFQGLSLLLYFLVSFIMAVLPCAAGCLLVHAIMKLFSKEAQ